MTEPTTPTMTEPTTTNSPEHVFTKDEAVKTLTDFIAGLSDETKAAIDPNALASLESVSDALVQAFARIDQLNQTVANLQKVSEDYKAKIASYAADQASRMAQASEQEEEKNPAEVALQKIESEDD